MIDPKTWALASAQFQALRNNIPASISESLVNEYHGIVRSFEAATGENFGSFRIPASEVNPRLTSFGPRGSTYSSTRFCKVDFFKRQVQGLAAYLEHLAPVKPTSDSRDYDTLTDEQLEALAHTHHIGGYGDAHGINRRIIIDALRERDRSLAQPLQGHVLHIGHVSGSIIQQAPSHSPATLNYKTADIDSIVSKVKAAMGELPLSNGEKSELDIEIRTLELQLTSAKPKKAIVDECLRSTRSILEGVAGSLIASGIVFEITKLLGP